MNTTSQITKRIESYPQGKPFLTKSLLEYGTRAAVDKALSRLTERGVITRVARGVYVRPKFNELLGVPVLPGPAEVAKALAESENARLGVHGAEAARRLGLSTQVPSQPIFISSGAPRKFTLGKLVVHIKGVPPKKVVLAGREAGVAHSALLYLGKEQVTSSILKKVESAIGPEEFEALESKRQYLPAWLSDALLEYRESPQGLRG